VGVYLGVGEGRQDFSYSMDIPKQESIESARIIGWNKTITTKGGMTKQCSGHQSLAGRPLRLLIAEALASRHGR